MTVSTLSRRQYTAMLFTVQRQTKCAGWVVGYEKGGQLGLMITVLQTI
jgi:hypothetical protein